MSEYTTERIRNVVLVGHSGVGKTTLAEAMLHCAGVTTRQGTVDGGTSVLDTDPDELSRQSSVSLGVASFDWTVGDDPPYRINLLDTPGHPDFAAEVDAAMSVADLAIVVVSAPDGVEIGTEIAWRKCVAAGIPRMVFVTREGKYDANFERVLASLRQRFGGGFTAVELPLGEADEFHGVADVLAEEAHEYEGGHHVEPLPDDIAEHEHEVHDEVVEEIVSADDEQLERYLDGEELSVDDLEQALRHEVRDCERFPVLCGSGTKAIGVDRLLDYICHVGTSPSDRPREVGVGDEVFEIVADASEQPLAYVFKTVSDEYVGRVSFLKVMTGTLEGDTTLVEVSTGTDERLHALHSVCGSEHTRVDRLVAGDIGAVGKLGTAATGTTLAPASQLVRVEPPSPPAAHMAVVLVPETQSDDDRLAEALQRITQEDPSLQASYDELSRRTVLRGVGDTHIAVALSRLEHRYGVTAQTDEVRVPYRRTVRRGAEAQGRVKKQSGGHGQFAVVDLKVSPLGRGEGFEFVDSVVGGAIPKQYISAVEHGVAETMQTGGHIGIPIVDLRVECVDGKTHSVDSSDMAFKTAAGQGLLEAVEAAGPVLLEPIQRLQIRVPVDAQGDVLGDVNSRRGRVVGSEQREGDQWITAEVPVATSTRYAMELRSLTGGRGAFWVTDTFYDAVPDHETSSVLAQYQS